MKRIILNEIVKPKDLSVLEPIVSALLKLKEEDFINEYAIGGAFGTLFYTEPFETADVDVFFTDSSDPDKLLSMTDIRNFLFSLGGTRGEKDDIQLGGFPVQLLPTSPIRPWVEEAINNARLFKDGDLEVRVFPPEYLLLEMADKRRDKDKVRAPRLMSQTKIDKQQLDKLLTRFRLVDKWKQLKVR